MLIPISRFVVGGNVASLIFVRPVGAEGDPDHAEEVT